MSINRSVAISKEGVMVNCEIEFDSMPKDMALRDYLRSMYHHLELKYSKFYKMDDFCKLGFLAVEWLLKEVNERPSKDRIGLFLLNQYSSIESDISFYNTYSVDIDSIASPSLFVYTLPNILIGEISIRHQITGEHAFFLQQDFELEFIYLYVKTLFDTGVLDAAIIGRCEVTSWEFFAKMSWFSKHELRTICNAKQFNEWINKKP
jgi:hypothetical protein